MTKGKKFLLEKNKFFDINKFNKDKGLILFPISMSRADNSQSPRTCLKYIKNLNDKVVSPCIGLNFIYGDFLYLHSSIPSFELKEKYMNMVVNHKNSMKKLLFKERKNFQIQHAFNFMSWNQLYFDIGDFPFYFRKLKSIYKKDKKFQKYIKEDADFFSKKLDENQLNFFLEEHLMFYLGSFGKIDFPNDYIQGREKWILWVYPGRAPKALVYLFQLNPFSFKNNDNIYANAAMYNPERKELYNFENIDLDTYSLE